MVINKLDTMISQIIKLSIEAGHGILELMDAQDMLNISRKADNTLLTAADLRSHDIIEAGLRKLTPSVPILSEEGVIPSFHERSQWAQYWLIDPLDGTRGFVDRSDEFTVNIAFIDNHESVLGVVYAPMKKRCFWAFRDGGAFMARDGEQAQRIHASSFNWQKMRMLVGKYHGRKRVNLLQEALPGLELMPQNSSLKFCRIACSEGDFYPRFGPISEWDTAAGHCVLSEAGGDVVDFTGKSLQYNARDTLLTPEFVAFGDLNQKDQLLNIMSDIRSRS